MAIKLEIPQTSQSNMNYTNSAVSMKSDRNFGNMVADPIQLPRVNASGRFQSDMAIADSIGDGYRAAAKTMSDISNQIFGHLQAADDNKGNEVYLGLQAKHSEINASNMERVSKGEINVMQLPDENKKMFQEEARNQIENSALNFNETRNKMYGLADRLAANQYEQDTRYSIAKNTEDLKNGLNAQVSTLANQAQNSLTDFQTSAAQLDQMAVNDKRVVGIYGTDVFRANSNELLQKAGRTLLKNTIESDPYKADELMKSGSFEQVLSHLPESERGVFETDIRNKQIEVENKSFSSQVRNSNLTKGDYELQMAQGTTPLISDIVGNDKLMSDDKASLILKVKTANEQTEANLKSQKAIQEKLAATGDGTALTDSEVDKHALVIFAPTIQENKGNVVKLGETIKQAADLYGNRVPDFMIQQLNKPSSPESEKDWANVVSGLQKTNPDLTKKLNQTSLDVAVLMTNYDLSYSDAVNRHTGIQQRLQDDKLSETMSKGIASDSIYHKPDDTITKYLNDSSMASGNIFGSASIDKAQIPENLKLEFRNQYLKEKELGGTDAAISQRVMTKMNYGISNIGGQTIVMKNPPEKVITNKNDYEMFKGELEQVKKHFELDNVTLEPTSHVEKGIPVYRALNPNTLTPLMDDNHKPILIYPDSSAYEDVKLKTTTPGESMGTGHLRIIENQYPDTLNKYPGILSALWQVESGKGKNMLNPSTGAEGHFQFLPKTSEWKGLKNPYDFKESSQKAANYLDELIKQNKGNVHAALAQWNGATTPSKKEKFINQMRDAGARI